MYFTIDPDILWLSMRVLSIAGIWPETPNNFRLIVYILYLYIFNCFEFVSLISNIFRLNFEKSVRNMTESIPTALVILKVMMFRRNMYLLLPLLSVIRNDKSKKINEFEEQSTAAWYNIIGKLYTRAFVILAFVVSAMLYVVPLSQWIIAKNINSTLSYNLPYQMDFGFEINDMISYTLACFCLLPVSACLTIGCTGADSLLVVLIFYLCGQFALLSERIKRIEPDQLTYRKKMKPLVERHATLISEILGSLSGCYRMATALNKTFSSLLLVQTIGLSFVICLVAFELLMMAEDGQETNTLSFIIYSMTVIILLFNYCILGECLIHESSSIDVACYFSKWYQLPPDLASPITISIARSRKPVCLTAGKFYVFSLETFTTVMKGSMAYLSVLRQMK